MFNTPLYDSCGVFEVNFINDSDPFNGQDPNSMTFSWFVDSTFIDNGFDLLILLMLLLVIVSIT